MKWQRIVFCKPASRSCVMSLMPGLIPAPCHSIQAWSLLRNGASETPSLPSPLALLTVSTFPFPSTQFGFVGPSITKIAHSQRSWKFSVVLTDKCPDVLLAIPFSLLTISTNLSVVTHTVPCLSLFHFLSYIPFFFVILFSDKAFPRETKI